MRPRPLGARRFTIIVVLVASLVTTLVGRLYYVQLLDPNKPHQSAGVHPGSIVVPAPRGLIVDSTGQALVDNVTIAVMTLDQHRIAQLPGHGKDVLARVAALIEVPEARLAHEILPCSVKVPAPCWTGLPYQPVPVATGLSRAAVLRVSEHREDFPGVTISTQTLPHYPSGSLAGQLLGYTAQITAADKKRDPSLVDADTIGVSGLQEQYDRQLRGVDGARKVALDAQGYAVAGTGYDAPKTGDTLVTSLDGRLQKVAEASLAQQIHDSRAAGEPATSGAIVAMDPQTGRVLAAASYPDYDPQQFVGGISNADYAKLTAPSANDPLLDRAIAGQYAPGSTFKLITSSSLLDHHEINTTSLYGCPGSVSIDGRVKTNYDSEVLGPIDLENALGYSCDTFFYVPAANEYYADENRIEHGLKPHEWLQHTAADFGVGRSPGIDLPAAEQATGSYADRETRLARWKANRKTYCAAARAGYQNIENAHERAYLTELASENCTDGWRYRAGDNADMAIGQGETTMSPLQLATAYSALVNGGKLYTPRLGWGIESPAGKLLRTIVPKVHNKVPASQSTLDYIAKSLNFSRGYAVSGAFAYLDSPYAARIGGKTGTAEVYGKKDTSWLASWGPIYKVHGHVRARIVLVGMVEQAGTGATAAGPMLKRVWDAIFGIDDTDPDHPKHVAPLLPGLRPVTTMPTVRAPR